MIPKIKSLTTIKDYKLDIIFDDGKHVIYDVADDMAKLPNYDMLKKIPMLFEQAQLDPSRTCVYWNEEIDLPSDTIYEYGITI